MNKHTSSEKEIQYLQLYMESLASIRPADDSEKEALFHANFRDNKTIRDRLAEIYLMDAVQIAAEYRDQGVPLADLIQEANLGLMNSLSESQSLDDLTLKMYIRNAVKNAIEMEQHACDTEEHIALQINRLNEASQELTERHGKEPSLSELANYLHMTEQDIRHYMKISLDALNTSVDLDQ